MRLRASFFYLAALAAMALTMVNCDRAASPGSNRSGTQQAFRITAADVENRKAELHGLLAPSVAPAMQLADAALAAELSGDFTKAKTLWDRAQKVLTSSHNTFLKRRPFQLAINPPPYDKRPLGLVPALFCLDLARVQFQLGDLDKAERAMQDFHVAASGRFGEPSEVNSDPHLGTTPAQEPVVLDNIALCRAMLAHIQAKRTEKIASWQKIHVIEDVSIDTKEAGTVRIKMLSPVATRKELQGAKFIAAYFGSKQTPRFTIHLTDRAFNWDFSYLPPKEREEQSKQTVVSLFKPEPTNTSPVSIKGVIAHLSLCFTPNSGDGNSYNVYPDAFGYTSGGS